MAIVVGMNLKPVFDGLMGVANVLRDADKIPEWKTILDAYARMHEMQGTIHELTDKLRETEKELRELKEARASVEGSTVERGVLWLKDDPFPRCLHCYDAEQKLIHVKQVWSSISGNALECPRCHEEVRGELKR